MQKAVALFLCFSAILSAGIGLLTVPRQAGCPVAVQSATSTEEFLFESITVRNVSSKKISGIAAGILVKPDDNAQGPGILFNATPMVEATLAPGEQREVKVYGARAKSFQDEIQRRTRTPEPYAILGIVKVVYADGSSWEANAQAKGFVPEK